MTNFLFKPKYSVFTMALLEDSGWYKPDYTMADNLFHGKNQKCSFLTE